MALRKSITEQEFSSLINMAQSGEDLIRIYSLSGDDIVFIKASCRGKANHIRASILLSYMRFPGIIIPAKFNPDERILDLLCNQLEIDKSYWKDYDNLSETRQDHINILRKNYGYENFSSTYYTDALLYLTKFALQTDKGILIAQQLVQFLRDAKILIPKISVVQKICSEALINAERQIYDTLSSSLSHHQKHLLDALLNLQEKGSVSQLNWLKQSPQAVNSKFLLMHIKRLKTIKEINLPKDIGKDIHQNRLLK